MREAKRVNIQLREPEQDMESPRADAAMPQFQHVAILHHPKIEATGQVAEEIQNWLAGRDIESWLALTWEETDVRPRLPDSDLIIVLGGDGSMLRAARMAAGNDIPILGVNMGRIGFLAELGAQNWPAQLDAVFRGDYWVEPRMMLLARTWRGDSLRGEHLALNDVVISRGSLARVVRLNTIIDSDRFTTYVADGLIVSTPTGSTAYAFAAGGPILPPELRNIILVPIAAHLTLDRAIVLSEGSKVCIEVSTDHQAILTVDGQFEFEMQDGDRIEVQASDHVSRFLRLGKRTYFYHTLLARLEPNQAPVEG
jgi:NAD+ kinase